MKHYCILANKQHGTWSPYKLLWLAVVVGEQPYLENEPGYLRDDFAVAIIKDYQIRNGLHSTEL